MLLTVYLSLSLYFFGCTPKNLPSFIEKCRKSDPNFNRCMGRNAVDALRKLKDGNKELGVVPLDPFIIEKVDLGNRVSGGTLLHLIYENMKITGMTNVTVDNTDISVEEKCDWRFDGKFPAVHIESDYKMKGQMLLFSINGFGKSTIDLYNLECIKRLKCENYIKKNRSYLRVTDFKFDIKPEKIVINFENIIDGNEQLSKEVVKSIHENSKEVFEVLVPTFIEVLGAIWKQIVNQVFSKVPEDKLFSP